MESVFQTIKEIKLFFANLIVKMTGLNDDQVLIQFPERGMGTQDIKTNMIYVDVDDETDIRTIYKNRDKIFTSEDNTYRIQQQSTRTLKLRLIFYGANAFELSRIVCEKMYFDSYKIDLDNNYLYLVPERTEGPTNIHELKNGRYYDRSDLQMIFYNPVVIEDKVGIFENANIELGIDP